MPRTRPARCLFRLSDAKVVFFRYTANDLQVFFIVSCIFFVFPSLGVLCRGCFLVFSSFSPFIRAGCLLLYICTRTHAGGVLAPWLEGWDHPPGRGWFLPWWLMVDPLRPSASPPLKRGQCRNAGGIIDGWWVLVPDAGEAGAGGRSSGRGGARGGARAYMRPERAAVQAPRP